MATPVQLKVLLDLSDGLTFNETSADCYEITDIIITANTRRGRSRELDKIESGYAVVTLVDENGDFNPDNTSSPYYGKLKPGNKIRLYPEYDDGTGPFRYPDIFTGYIINYRTRFSMGVNEANQIIIEANDAFKVFNTISITNVTNSTSGDFSDERIDKILDEINWPFGQQLLENSTIALSADPGTQRTVLDALRQVEDTEAGIIFIDGSGNVVFKNRATTNTQPNYNDAYKFSDDGTETSYNDLRLTQNDNLLINKITINSYNGSNSVTVYDSTSEVQYFSRSAERNNILLTSTSDLQLLGEQLLENFKDSSLQIDRIILNLAEYEQVDRVIAGLYFDIFFIPVYIKKTLSGNTTINRLGWLQGVNHDITKNTWLVTGFTGLTSPYSNIPNWLVNLYTDTGTDYILGAYSTWYSLGNNGNVNWIATDSNDNLFVVAYYKISSAVNVMISKLDSQGNVLNTVLVDDSANTTGTTIIPNIVENGNDGIVLHYASDDFISWTGSDYSYITKLDNSLNFVWGKKINRYGSAVILRKNNNNEYFIFNNNKNSSNYLVSDLIKFDANGNTQFEKRFYRATSEFNYVDMAVNDNNNIVILGRDDSGSDSLNGVLRLNNSGEIQSQFFYLASTDTFNQIYYEAKIKIDNNENVYIIENQPIFSYPYDGMAVAVTKINGSNELLWSNIYTTPLNTTTDPYTINPLENIFDTADNLIVQLQLLPSSAGNKIVILEIDSADGSINKQMGIANSLNDNFNASSFRIDTTGRLIIPTNYGYLSNGDYDDSQTIASFKPAFGTFGNYALHGTNTFNYTSYDFAVFTTNAVFTTQTSDILSTNITYSYTTYTSTITATTTEILTVEFD